MTGGEFTPLFAGMLKLKATGRPLPREGISIALTLRTSWYGVFSTGRTRTRLLYLFSSNNFMKVSSRIKMYLRAYRFMAKGLLSTDHPVLAHIIPMRRCNLSCSYCNEYDDYSSPVPTEEMFE